MTDPAGALQWPTLDVCEVFETLQGEATFTGTPAVFIRLQGCDVGCPWCDTKPTWEADPRRRITPAEFVFGSWIHRFDPSATSMPWARFQVDELAELVVSNSRARHVVITGGEPLMQDIAPLVALLNATALIDRVQVETSGTRSITPKLRLLDPWLTVSPKIAMPGGREIVGATLQAASEIKWPVGKLKDLDELTVTVDTLQLGGKTIWLQPLSTGAKSTQLCIEAALANGSWRVSFQTHKFAGLA